VLEILNDWVRAADGPKVVTVRLTNSSSYVSHLLRGADETGIVVSPTERPEELIAYPWGSIFGVAVRAK
jgi:hypothetical protein